MKRLDQSSLGLMRAYLRAHGVRTRSVRPAISESERVPLATTSTGFVLVGGDAPCCFEVERISRSGALRAVRRMLEGGPQRTETVARILDADTPCPGIE